MRINDDVTLIEQKYICDATGETDPCGGRGGGKNLFFTKTDRKLSEKSNVEVANYSKLPLVLNFFRLFTQDRFFLSKGRFLTSCHIL